MECAAIFAFTNSLPETIGPLTARVTEVQGQAMEIGRVLESVKESATAAGVSHHARLFAEEAASHEHAAEAWLRATWIAALFTVLAGVGSVFWFFKKAAGFTAAQGVQLAVGKILVLSFLVTGVVWIGRIYRSHRHNYVINKHRQNALSTFETFAMAAPDAQTKAAVLLQATQSIFAPQHTGFLAGEGEGPHSTQILEIVRGLGPADKVH